MTQRSIESLAESYANSIFNKGNQKEQWMIAKNGYKKGMIESLQISDKMIQH